MDSGKQTAALRLLQSIALSKRIIVSAQVINEFHWILSRKYKIPEELIRDKVENGLVKLADIVPLEYSDYQFSFHIRKTWGLSFWDSLIVASALQNECSTLYSEDFSRGIKIEKTLQILNPFL